MLGKDDIQMTPFQCSCAKGIIPTVDLYLELREDIELNIEETGNKFDVYFKF